MNYRSVYDLTQAVGQLLPSIPREVDLVVGIPRSGMLPASLLALALDLPLADLDCFLAGSIARKGATRAHESKRTTSIAAVTNVLLVDDSVHTGAALREALERLNSSSFALANIWTVAIYGTPSARFRPNFVAENVGFPRVFEWNILHHPDLKHFAIDIDGVLCRDPTARENDDGPLYRSFINSAAPRVLPSKPVGALVTSRLSAYRVETEAWLARHGVRYHQLFMLDGMTAEERRKKGAHASFKAEVYRNSPYWLFIESEPAQAEEIARLAARPVLCSSTGELVQPGEVHRRLHMVRAKSAFWLRNLSRLRNVHKLPEKLRGLVRRHRY